MVKEGSFQWISLSRKVVRKAPQGTIKKEPRLGKLRGVSVPQMVQEAHAVPQEVWRLVVQSGVSLHTLEVLGWSRK